MDAHTLIVPASPLGYPTPFWFIELFKVLGFSLHVAPMNLWYAGMPIAVLLGAFGRGHARTAGRHITRALPFALAFGINFGIVPLLFVQVAYYQFFYPATVLMAWPWFAVFWIVMAGYFMVYLYRLAIDGKGPVRLSMSLGWLAAGAFLVVGFIFANAMSLLASPDKWWGVFRDANVAGAASGLALNLHDPTLIPRWLFMFALAITTTAAYVMVDAAFMSHKDGQEYRRFAGRFAAGLYTVGLGMAVGFGSWYIFGTRPFALPEAMRNPVMRVVFPLTAVSPGLPWLLIMLQWRQPTRRLAALAGVAQFVVIALNAISRQWLQNTELGSYTNLATRPVDLQLSALVVFLVIFVGGLGLVAWMCSKAVEVNRREA